MEFSRPARGRHGQFFGREMKSSAVGLSWGMKRTPPPSVRATLMGGLLALGLIGIVGQPARAALSTDFPTALEEQGTTLIRAGATHLKVGWIFSVYDAAYYVAEGSTAIDSLTRDVARRLDIRYLRSIPKDQFVAYADKALARMLTPAELEALADRINQINAAYQDVSEGDMYSLTYLPGVGTRLDLNGKELVLIPGADFALAYFRIWIDASNAYTQFRQGLMGLTK
ncbi:MAG: chalcone isomerase family protein [Kiritimatiellae bacterium]|nr:chalcone isomerase family protein [Kiritimatiellia bacterium]